MAPVKRSKPLHVVADSRGSMLEEFVDRLHIRRTKGSQAPDTMLLTTDILPTERLSAGFFPLHRTSFLGKGCMLSVHLVPVFFERREIAEEGTNVGFQCVGLGF